MEEDCLWVTDMQAKNEHGTSKENPEKYRCKPNGKVFCWTCWQKYFGSLRRG